jgi:hypothetical protein
MSEQPDDVLAHRLDDALREGLGADQVDVGSLLVGVRRRARIVRTRRAVAAAAVLAAVLAVPVGYEVLHPTRGVSAPPAAMIPGTSGSPARTLYARRPATAFPLPSAGGPASADGRVPTVSRDREVIPDRLAFSASHFPSDLTLRSSTEELGADIVGDLACDRKPASSPKSLPSAPLGARHWRWTSAGGAEVDLIVSRWSGTDATPAVSYVVKAGCLWRRLASRELSSEQVFVPNEATWVSMPIADDNGYSQAMIRSGPLVAGVRVRHPDGVKAAESLAVRLARIEAGLLAARRN